MLLNAEGLGGVPATDCCTFGQATVSPGTAYQDRGVFYVGTSATAPDFSHSCSLKRIYQSDHIGFHTRAFCATWLLTQRMEVARMHANCILCSLPSGVLLWPPYGQYAFFCRNGCKLCSDCVAWADGSNKTCGHWISCALLDV
jgi:hypothetical protein